MKPTDKRSLMVSAVGCTPEGKTKRTMTKIVHAMAIIPIGLYHLPKENGPGSKVCRPEVSRRKIGVTYEMLRAMTVALQRKIRVISCEDILSHMTPQRTRPVT